MGRPQSNRAQYFLHMEGMRNHRKVKALKTKFGPLKGYSFWCMMLEWLCGCDGIEWEYSDLECELFAADLGVSAAEIKEMVEYCLKIELLFKTESNFIYSESLNEYLAPLFEKRERERERSKSRQRREDGAFKKEENQVSATEKTTVQGISVAEIPHNRIEKNKEKENTYKDFDEAEASSPDKDSFLKSLAEERSKPIDEQNLKSIITKFIRNHKPSFIEPYQEIWNLFAEEKGFPKLIKVTASRKKKFASRVKDPAFDFPTILKKANQSEFIAQGNWFGFDWIIENDTNFLKVLEGKYDKKQSDEQNQPNKQNENIKKKVRAVA